jgi:hypothetical protein
MCELLMRGWGHLLHFSTWGSWIAERAAAFAEIIRRAGGVWPDVFAFTDTTTIPTCQRSDPFVAWLDFDGHKWSCVRACGPQCASSGNCNAVMQGLKSLLLLIPIGIVVHAFAHIARANDAAVYQGELLTREA